MFGGSRRHRPPVQPLTKETANPNAATAAASAFMRREPSVSLSSAAAAAALKARPTTPTNVAQTPSKRAQRRSASVSSTGSRERGRRELQRTPSTGSMSERTFRSPSPGRSQAPRPQDVPPVPSVPDHERFKPEKTSSGHRRAVSLQTQPFRTASQKLKDGQGSGQGSWFGAATAGDLHNVRHSAIESKVLDDPRAGSISPSINFSYPRARVDSPAGVSDQTLVYDPNSRRMVPREELLRREREIIDASQKPVKKKKTGVSRGGSHLSKGTVARTKGTAVEHQPPPPEQPHTTEKTTQLTPDHIQTPEPTPPAQIESQTSREQTLVESDSEESAAEKPQQETGTTTILPPSEPLQPVVLGRKPSVVEEDPELESELDDELNSDEEPGHLPNFVSDQPTQAVNSQPETQVEEPPKAKVVTDQEPQPIEARQERSPRRTRVHSESPVRTTHFAPTAGHLLVRHEPPPRSVSPRKSALKQRSPTRATSPSDDSSELSSVGFGPKAQDDVVVARKKSVRVSFDDQNTVVVGESAEPQVSDSPVLASPQTKRPWHNIIARTRRGPTPLDENERMTPRPALPSFGSVREKKAREPEERPLVRPLDRDWSTQSTSTPPRQSSPSPGPAGLGQSSDLAIGSILAQEQSSRNAANISKYREPLPPVVTSVESSGYISNTPSSSDDEEEMERPVQLSAQTLARSESIEEEEEEEEEESPSKNSLNGSTLKNDVDTRAKENGNVPAISIIQASPRMQEEGEPTPQQEYFDVPGGFPTEGTSGPSGEQETTSEQIAPATPQRSLESMTVSTPSSQMHDIKEEEEESDGSSIYSDAYEDLSELEGNVFMSLDAILESPTDSKAARKLGEKAVANSKELNLSQDTTSDKQTEEPLKPPKTLNDWEAAKAYWKSLTIDKRRQLEQEAMEEAGEEADLDETQQPKKKPTKRKSLDHPRTQTEVAGELGNSTRSYQIQPGTKWIGDDTQKSPVETKAAIASGSKLRKSTRGEQVVTTTPVGSSQTGGMRKSMRLGASPSSDATDGHLRKSMRAGSDASATVGPSGMRTTLRSNGNAPESRSSLKKGARPVSYHPDTATEPATAHKRIRSAERPTASPANGLSPFAKPQLRRRGSDSSESSFRRMRPSGGEGFGFRKTMRGSLREPAPPPAEGGKGSSRFSLRSLSPTGSAFRRNSNASSPPPMTMGGRMRTSMRRPQSSDGSSSRMGLSAFGRSPGKKAAKSRSSRFADSSDEDEAPNRFSSRFADSSDEDEIASLPAKSNAGLPRSMRAPSTAAAAAMGVPASQTVEEDSPDLPDSDDEVVEPRRNGAANGTAGLKTNSSLSRSGSGRASLGPSSSQALGTQTIGTTRPDHRRRGSFMSILRRKKDPSDKISRVTGESAARRDTRLERSTEQLAVIRSNSGGGSARLRKRGPSWPLVDNEDEEGVEEVADSPPVDDEKRPSTANGPPPAAKPGFLNRRSNSHQGTIGVGDISPEAYKKKKFGALRKMFRLND